MALYILTQSSSQLLRAANSGRFQLEAELDTCMACSVVIEAQEVNFQVFPSS